MTRFIIHIGPHKTGTTYIQETLAVLSERLREQGVCIPSIWNAASEIPSHMKLVWAIREHNLALVKKQIDTILAQRDRLVVISCEALSRFGQEQIALLRQLLGEAPVQIVYYVRRWPERLPSLWQEEVKFGHAATLPEFLTRQFTRYAASELWDVAVIDRFVRTFGAEHVKIVSYSNLTDKNIDIANHFLNSIVDLPNLGSPVAGRPNRSLDILDTELIRALNAIEARHGGPISPALREWYLRNKEHLVPECVFNMMRGNVEKIKLDEAAPLFERATIDISTRYKSSCVPPVFGDTLHALRAIEVSYVRQDYLLDKNIFTILKDLHKQFIAGNQS